MNSVNRDNNGYNITAGIASGIVGWECETYLQRGLKYPVRKYMNANFNSIQGGGFQPYITKALDQNNLTNSLNIWNLNESTADKIKQKWNKDITVTKSSKRIDFAVNTPNKLYLIETNFYGGGGSKLKSTAGEYAEIYHQWTNDGHQFIWITDGLGWLSTKRPLRDTFDNTDYIINLEMIQKGVLEELLK